MDFREDETAVYVCDQKSLSSQLKGQLGSEMFVPAEELPTWANYLAVDLSGRVFVFSDEPSFNPYTEEWLNDDGAVIYKCLQIGATYHPLGLSAIARQAIWRIRRVYLSGQEIEEDRTEELHRLQNEIRGLHMELRDARRVAAENKGRADRLVEENRSLLDMFGRGSGL